jgi:hypothetical protein
LSTARPAGQAKLAGPQQVQGCRDDSGTLNSTGTLNNNAGGTVSVFGGTVDATTITNNGTPFLAGENI